MYGSVLWFQATIPEHAVEVPNTVKFFMVRIYRLKAMHEEGVLSLWLDLDHYMLMFQPHRVFNDVGRRAWMQAGNGFERGSHGLFQGIIHIFGCKDYAKSW